MERVFWSRNAFSLHIGTHLKELISSKFLPKNKYDEVKNNTATGRAEYMMILALATSLAIEKLEFVAHHLGDPVDGEEDPNAALALIDDTYK